MLNSAKDMKELENTDSQKGNTPSSNNSESGEKEKEKKKEQEKNLEKESKLGDKKKKNKTVEKEKEKEKEKEQEENLEKESKPGDKKKKNKTVEKEKEKEKEKEVENEGQKDYLTNLPPELGELILSNLNPPDLGSVSLVAKKQHELVQGFLSQTYGLVGLFRSKQNPHILGSLRTRLQKVHAEHEKDADRDMTCWDLLAKCLTTDNVMALDTGALKKAIETLSDRLSTESKEFFARQLALLDRIIGKVGNIKSIENEDLSCLNLAGANFGFAMLKNVNLSGSNLTSSSFGRTTLENVNLGGANLTSAFFGSSTLSELILIDVKLQKMAILQDTIFVFAEMFREKCSDFLISEINSLIANNLPLDQGPDKPLIKVLCKQLINNFNTAVAKLIAENNIEAIEDCKDCLEQLKTAFKEQGNDETLERLFSSSISEIDKLIEQLEEALSKSKPEPKQRCSIM
jgi:hypothetical protein